MKQIALADDHTLLRAGLADLLEKFGYKVILEASDGQELIDKISAGSRPDLVLMDIKMSHKDGFEATQWLKDNYPDIKVLAVSMLDDEEAILKMLRCGANGYLLKGAEPAELRTAMEAVFNKGYYYSDIVTGRMIHSITTGEAERKQMSELTDRELEFLKMACSELTYKEIASQMHLSPRTIDGYRDSLFEKLNIKTRTGLAIYAIKKGIVKL